MNTGDRHPDSGAPYVPVPRAEDPCIRVSDLAILEFAGPQGQVAEQFFTGFGLRASQAEGGSLRFAAEAGAPYAVVYRPAPRAAFIGPTFAAAEPADLDRLAERAGVAGPSPLDLPGRPPGVVLTDPNGLDVKVAWFEDWRGLPGCGQAPAVNRGDARERVNSPVRPARSPSRVLRLAHMVLGTPQWEATARFYIDNFGLIPSDVLALPDGRPVVAFLRCDRGSEPADHHTFVVGRLPLVDFEHAAFEVPDLDDVGMGGEVMKEGGFERAWGIGRHILGSQIFDYWYGPDGRKFEHFTDGDLFDASHPTAHHPMSAAGLAQWGPPVPQKFLRPRLDGRGFLRLVRNLFGGSAYGLRELRQMASAMRSRSLPS